MIPIVMAVDNNYLIPSLVAVKSIVSNKDTQSTYKFFFLISKKFYQPSKQLFEEILKPCGIASCFIEVDDRYEAEQIHIKHTSTATFYRLLLPDLLDFDKCIYLDSDIVVLNDLSALFDQIDDNYLIAGVKAATYYWPEKNKIEKANYLSIDSLNTYINAGVLVMNLKLMRKMNISLVFSQLKERNFVDQDQDIINKACYGYIKTLSPKYNSMTKYNNDNSDYYGSRLMPCLKECYTKKEWIEACEKPIIIHYADTNKPWNTKVPYFETWWLYLKEVDKHYSCYNEVYNRFLIKNRKNVIRKLITTPYKTIKILLKGLINQVKST